MPREPAFQSDEERFLRFCFHPDERLAEVEGWLCEGARGEALLLAGEPLSGRSYLLEAAVFRAGKAGARHALFALDLDGYEDGPRALSRFWTFQLRKARELRSALRHERLEALKQVVQEVEVEVPGASWMVLVVGLAASVRLARALLAAGGKRAPAPDPGWRDMLGRLCDELRSEGPAVVLIPDTAALSAPVRLALLDETRRVESLRLAFLCRPGDQEETIAPRAEVRRVEVAPLDWHQVRKVIEQRFAPHRLPGALFDALARYSAGNPGRLAAKMLEAVEAKIVREDLKGTWELVPNDLCAPGVVALFDRDLYQPIDELLLKLGGRLSEGVGRFVEVAALCGELFPAGLILEHVEEAREARDELLDRVEAELVEEGSLRYFLDFEYHHPGSPEAIVYAWASPLLRQAVLLRLGAKAANLAGRFLAFLRQRQPQRTREIARIEVELASYLDDPEERERSLRELGWWIEIDQAEELQALLEQDLRSGRLDPERLFDAAQAADRSRATRRWAMLEALAQVPGTLPAPRLFGYHLLRGEVLWDLARFRDAQAEAKLALRIGEAQSGRVSQERAGALALQGLSYLRLGQFGAAEGSLREALAVALELLGPDHPGVAINLRNLASLLEDTRRLSEAEPLLRQALAIDEAAFGPDHPTVAIDLNGLAWVLNQTGRLGEAETLARRALAIDEAASGPDHPAVATRLSILGTILYDANRLAEAEPLLRRALAISEAFLGPEHPRVASHLSVLGALLRATNRLGEAESLVRRALAIDEATLGQEHPEVALQLNNLAALLCDSDRMGEAEPLARRALDIDEGSFGANHPAVARDLGNLAWLLEHTARVAEAEPLMRRALQILLVFRRQNGHPHPDFQAACARYRALLAAQGRTEAEIEAVIAELEQTTGDADLEEPSPEKAPA